MPWPGYPSNVRSRLPLVASHNFIVLSPLPDSTRPPSGENATERIVSECPSKVRTSCPVATSHSVIVLLLVVITRAPSGESATSATCPPNVRRTWPVAASHIFNALSPVPVKTRVPSRENATEPTKPECPPKLFRSASVCSSHIPSLLFQPPERILA